MENGADKSLDIVRNDRPRGLMSLRVINIIL